MKSTKNAEKKRFQWYQENILIPAVKTHRKKYHGFDSDSGAPIPDKLTAVCACDGDLSQVANIKETVHKLKDLKIHANKQNASRSGVEQPADLVKVFMIIKKILPEYTATDLPADRSPVKDKLVGKWATDEDLLSLALKGNKKSTLIDFLAVLPDVVTKACDSKNIRTGFIAAGIIDKDNYRFPVLNKILATCRRNVTKEESDNILDLFEHFLTTFDEQGHIPEEVFDMYGIINDFDANRNVYRRDAGILQESWQRAKCLTHEFQIKLRKQRLLDCQRHERLKKKRANDAHQVKVDANARAVKALHDMLVEDNMMGELQPTSASHSSTWMKSELSLMRRLMLHLK